MLRIYIALTLLFFVIIAHMTSCKTIKLGIELITKELDGEELIANEVHVKKNLEKILLMPDEYTLTAYTRQVFSPDLKRTQHRYHSFFVVHNNSSPSYTLSFSGTKKWFTSEGAWAINTDSDEKSYFNYKHGLNTWDVQEVVVNKGIDTETTVKNIIERIDNETNYFYNDHRKNKFHKENCNTAMFNTMTENR